MLEKKNLKVKCFFLLSTNVIELPLYIVPLRHCALCVLFVGHTVLYVLMQFCLLLHFLFLNDQT